jgi:hypothetical protein
MLVLNQPSYLWHLVAPPMAATRRYPHLVRTRVPFCKRWGENAINGAGDPRPDSDSDVLFRRVHDNSRFTVLEVLGRQ